MTVCPIILPITPATEELLARKPNDHKYTLLTEEELQMRCPLELSPSSPTHQTAAKEATQSPISRKYVYLDYSYSFHPSKQDLADRVVLLLLGLAPSEEDLEKVKARTHFQTAVVVAQGVGFLLGVLQRLTQHLPVSAAEAAACIFSFIVIGEVLLDIIVCPHFKYPLQLRLSDVQADEFFKYERPQVSKVIHRLRFQVMLGVALLTLGVAGGACTLYIHHYWHVSLPCLRSLPHLLLPPPHQQCHDSPHLGYPGRPKSVPT